MGNLDSVVNGDLQRLKHVTVGKEYLLALGICL